MVLLMVFAVSPVFAQKGKGLATAGSAKQFHEAVVEACAGGVVAKADCPPPPPKPENP